ncbi:Crp/Fnr family transcriptional regulator [Jannaschia faecimaris]|uniref:Crp/Fnr family transcriptional regulator n=1 Tax=Jannaschia faecimaris TaxID=1244108 RepID=UPI000B84B116|nr:Crp/Fnr family transcriptional regulator [Jannaschia faecimaris]
MSEENRLTISDLERRRLTLRPTDNLVDRPARDRRAFVLLKGWTITYKILHDGSRQLLDCHVPGDILGFHCTQIQISDRFIEPLTEVEVAEFSIVDLMSAMNEGNGLSHALSWFLARDHAILVEHLINNGRRGALERVSHFFLELGVRMGQAGQSDPHDFPLPLTQYLLADMLGLSAIHVNRTLRDLRERELLIHRNGRVVILNAPRLSELCGFDPGYLMPAPRAILR